MKNEASNLAQETPWAASLPPTEEDVTDSHDSDVGREKAVGARTNAGEGGAPMVDTTSGFKRIPEEVLASGASERREYDARGLRSQREVIRDVMLSAAHCQTWLTLAELRAVTRYGEASISAQLRHLRKAENGGYEVVKRQREGAASARLGANGRGETVWEYRISPVVCLQNAAERAALRAAVGA